MDILQKRMEELQRQYMKEKENLRLEKKIRDQSVGIGRIGRGRRQK